MAKAGFHVALQSEATGVAALATGDAIGAVYDVWKNARGRLCHWAQTGFDRRVAAVAFFAPTVWKFHSVDFCVALDVALKEPARA